VRTQLGRTPGNTSKKKRKMDALQATLKKT